MIQSAYAPDGEPRSLSAIALDRTFGPFFGGKLSANVGIWIFNIAAVVLVFQITRSPLMVGIVSVTQFVPQLLLVTVSGVVADRGNRKLQLFIGRVLCAVGPTIIWVWLLVEGVAGVPAWVVMAASSFVGLGFALGGPAMQAILPHLVRPSETPKAVALDNFSFAVGRALGPALGGLLAAIDLTWAFAASALGHIIFAVAVAGLPRALSRPAGRAERSSSATGGLGYIASRPVIAAILLGVAAIGLGADPALTLAPSLADEVGRGGNLVGLFASSFGLGAFLIFFVQSSLTLRLGSHRLASIGLITMALGSLGLIATSSAAWALACFGLAGLGMTLSLTALGTELYARVTDEYRGRIMAFWLLGFVGSRPLGAGLNGALAELISVDAALVATALLVLGAAWLCRPSVLSRHRAA